MSTTDTTDTIISEKGIRLKQDCEHIFKPVGSDLRKVYDGEGISKYVRVDKFYCKECLGYKNKKIVGMFYNPPDWWMEKISEKDWFGKMKEL